MYANPQHRTRKITIVLLVIAFYVDYATLTAIIPILPVLLTDNGISELAVFLLFSSKSGATLICNPIFGCIADKRSPRPLFISCLVLLICATGLFVYGLESALQPVPQYVVLLAARTVQGIGSSGVMTFGMAGLAKLYTQQERGAAMGQAMSGVALGVLTGAPLAGVLADALNPSAPFLLLGGLGCVSLFFSLFVHYKLDTGAEQSHINATPIIDADALRKNEPLLPELSSSSSNLSHVASDVFRNLGEEPPKSALQLYMNPKLLLLALAVTIVNTAIAMIEPLVPLFLERGFGYGPGKQGLVFSIQALGYLLCTPAAGFLADKCLKTPLIIAGVVVTAIGMFFLFHLPASLFFVCLALACNGIGVGFVDTPSMSLFTLFGEGQEGSAIALQDFAVNLGFTIGPILPAVLPDTGPDAVFSRISTPMGIVCMVTAPLLLLVYCDERKILRKKAETFSSEDLPY